MKISEAVEIVNTYLHETLSAAVNIFEAHVNWSVQREDMPEGEFRLEWDSDEEMWEALWDEAPDELLQFLLYVDNRSMCDEFLPLPLTEWVESIVPKEPEEPRPVPRSCMLWVGTLPKDEVPFGPDSHYRLQHADTVLLANAEEVRVYKDRMGELAKVYIAASTRDRENDGNRFWIIEGPDEDDNLSEGEAMLIDDHGFTLVFKVRDDEGYDTSLGDFLNELNERMR